MAQDVPFTLTGQMVEVLGGEDSATFAAWKDRVTAAFMALRPYRFVVVSLAMAALGARLPHVNRVSDVRVVNDSLLPGLVATEAERVFRDLIAKALASKRALVNDSLHTFYMQNFYKASPQ
jgi:hypothetical protein